MKKQRRQILLLCILLILFLGGYFILRTYNQHEKEKEANNMEEQKIYVLNLKKEDIQKISYTYEGVNYTFMREEDHWIYAADTSVPINKSNMELMAGNAALIIAEEKIEAVPDLEQYGLSVPANTIQIETLDQIYHLYIGDYNTTIGKYYVYIDDPTTVYTVESNYITSFNKSLEDVTDKTEVTESVETTE